MFWHRRLADAGPGVSSAAVATEDEINNAEKRIMEVAFSLILVSHKNNIHSFNLLNRLDLLHTPQR